MNKIEKWEREVRRILDNTRKSVECYSHSKHYEEIHDLVYYSFLKREPTEILELILEMNDIGDRYKRRPETINLILDEIAERTLLGKSYGRSGKSKDQKKEST